MPSAPFSKRERSGRAGHGSSSPSRRPQKSGLKIGRFERLAQLLARLDGFAQPADLVVHQFFRADPTLGQKDRAFLAEASFAAIRRWQWIHARLIASGATARTDTYFRRRALMAAGLSIGFDRIVSELTEGEQHWLRAALEKGTEPPESFYAIPEWIWNDWLLQLGPSESAALAEAMDQPAPLDLRVNRIKASTEQVRNSLVALGLSAESLVLPHALRVRGRPALQKTQAFTDGWCEVQDLGSQLLVQLCAPGRGRTVVDFCAGAGGKTLALGALMHNSGRLYALDRSALRLAKLKPRLARSGLSNVWPIAISGSRDDRLKRLRAKADLVLVDAPCSGLGTLRRNPDLKWRQTPEGQPELIALQREILTAAAALVAPGGRLVYATCSTQCAENEQQIKDFLAEHKDFSLVPARQILEGQGVALPDEWRCFSAEGGLRLWPHRTETDGFFAMVLTRLKI